jgi:hypothetical protein
MRKMDSTDYQQAQLARIHDENIAPVTELCLQLREKRPESPVPFVDPVHDVDEARIISLLIAPGAGTSSGFLSLENDDDTAERLAEVYDAAGLQPRHGIPWNAYPWQLPEGQKLVLTPEQVHDGIRPLRQFLEIVYRASAVVAHGSGAHKVMAAFAKAGGDRILSERVIKVYKVDSPGPMGSVGSAAHKSRKFDEMVAAYADAMGGVGLPSKGR